MIGTICATGRSGSGARTIEKMLPRDHLLRRVDRLLDLGELRSALAPHYTELPSSKRRKRLNTPRKGVFSAQNVAM